MSYETVEYDVRGHTAEIHDDPRARERDKHTARHRRHRRLPGGCQRRRGTLRHPDQRVRHLVGSETASIGYPEIDVGLIPAMHFVHLPRQIGRHRAFELLFTGESIDAAEAADVGLFNEVVPQEEVLESAREFAATFNEKSPVVMELARDSFMRAQNLDYRRSIENVVETICNVMETEDTQEGLRAFAEKRDPDW